VGVFCPLFYTISCLVSAFRRLLFYGYLLNFFIVLIRLCLLLGMGTLHNYP